MLKKFKSIILSKKADQMMFAAMVTVGVVLLATPVYAAGEPGLVTNGKKALDSILTWLLILIVPAVGLALGWQGFKKSMADGDPGTVAAVNKSMKNILIGGAIALSASGIAKAVMAFFV